LRLVTGTGTVTNCTFVGNSASNVGGGLHNSANMSLSFSTFWNNNASGADGGGGVRQAGGGASLTINHVLAAGNKRGGSTTNSGADLSNLAAISGDYNLIQNATGFTFPATSTHNITGQDALLGPLRQNGGPTQTLALLAGSPAIDRGDPGSTQVLDQRGRPRPVDGDSDGSTLVDIGAFELSYTPPPVVDLNGSGAGLGFSTTFTEGGGAVFIQDANALTVSATDGALSSATVTLSNRLNGSDETLAATPSGAILAADISYSNGVLRITKTAPLADYQAVLRSVRYNNSSNAPSTATRGIDFVVSDGNSDSALATALVSITANDSPPLNTLPGAQSTAEDNALTLGVGRLISVSDADSGTLFIELSATNGTFSLSRTTGLAFEVGDGSDDAFMDFSGTPAQINAALNGLVFTPAANFHGAASLLITTRDGGNNSDVDTLAITVNPVNDAPVLSDIESSTAAFTEDGPAAVVTSSLEAVDVDGGDLAGATVSISGGFAQGQDELVFATQNNITGAFNAATGVLSLSGSAGVTAYRDALRSVTFRNTSQNPSTSVRTISFTVRDSASTSNALTRQVSVAAVNDAPQVLAPATQAATEDTDVVFSAANNNRVAVEDAESTQFQVTLTSTGGTLSLSRTTGLVFSVGDGTRDAAITFIGSGVNVNAALDGLRFHPTANASGSATLTVVVDDRGNSGSGGTLSNSKSVAITIAAQNDAPTIAAPAAISVQEDVASPLAGISFADEDAGANSVGVGFAVASGVLSAESANGVAVVGSGSGTLALSGSIAAINDFITQNRVAFTTASNATANVALSVNINDNGHSGGAAQSATRTVTLQVLAVNDAPVLSLPASYSAAEDTALALAGITVSDVDSAAGTVSLSLSVPAGSGVLRATGNANVGVVGSGTRSIAVSGSVASLNTFLDARSVEFMPALDLNGPVVLSATLSDGGNTGSGGVKTDSKTATITVAARADTPIVSNASTSEDTPSTSGLVITRNANDGAEVSHFQIANITDGALFQTNGTTPIQNGDFITASQGADGLRFTPRANFFGTASFEVRASISGDAAGLGGAPATASISVSAVADTPSVTDASTLEETQTTSGLVISPNAADGNSVSHFKISGISHGRLFHTDGTTEIENNSFITRAQGASGLKFTPALNFNGAASFAVRASISDADAGLGGEAVTATIAVSPLADTPSVSNASTSEDTQSSGGLVVTPDAADGDSVTHFQIANITNGKLFLANGTTEISGGSFITRAQGVAGLKFSPTANFFGDGSFQVRASISDTDAGLGGAPATATITVSAVAETPGVTGASTSEETQTTGDLVISRGAPDGEEVTHFKVSNISGGRVFLSDGTTEISGGEFISAAQGAAGLKFTPATDFFGTARFEVRGATSSTGAGLGAPATAEISVSAVADTPSVTDASTSEETQTTTGLVISPAAADADSVSHFKISNITSGRLFLNDGRTAIQNGDFISAAQGASGLKFTPALNFNGDASFQVRASTSDADAGLGGAAVTASITVSAVADTPSVTGASTSEDVQSSSGLVITPDVADGASVTHFKILSITNGKLFLADGTTEIENNSFITAAQGLGGLKFTPRANFFGEGSFQVRASTSATDAGLGGEAVTATIEVGAVADTPSATGASTLEETPTTDGLEITRNAVDGAEVTHLKVTAISNGRLFLLNGTTEIESNSFITFAQGAAGLRFAPSANFFGAATFKVQAATSNEDAGLGGDVVTITVTVAAVNDAPELSSADAAALAFTEGDAATRMTPRLVVFDVDSASLVGATVALSGFVAGQDVLGFTNQNNITGAFDAATGVLSLSGSASVDDYQAALRSVTFRNTSENPNTRARSASLRVDDGANDERLSNILTRAIEVESVNDAPQISTPSAQSVDEDTALVFSQTKGNLVSVSDVDVADGDVEVALSVANATLALAKTDGLKFTRGDGSGDAAMKFSGTPAAVNEALDGLAFAPDLNFNGPTALVVSVSDGGLTGSGGAKNAGESVAIAVRAVNDAPTVVAQSVGGREDTPFEITLRATDVDSRDFTFTITDAPQHGTLSGDGATRTFAPARDYNGPDSFSFMASDGALDSNTAVVTVTIGGENDAPVAAPDNASTPEDTPVDVQVLPGDTDIDGDRLAVKSVTTTSDAHGTVSVNANGTLRFVPDDNFNGKSTFTYTVTDGALEDSALVTVQVLAVNDAPVAQSQTVGTSEDTPLKITLVASDIDSPRLTFPIVTPPRFGTLSGSGASLTYTPAPDFNGGDTFAFKANDGDLDSNVALVTITVGGENDAPVAGDDSASTSEDTPAVLRVLDNDRDADGDKMRVVRVATTSATNGTVTISADNTLRFVPTPDFSGASTWSYTISDGQLESSAHVSMEVRAVNDAPTARPDTASTAQGTPIDVQVLANDSDVEGDTLKVVRAATHAGTHGTVSVNADGTLRFVPEANHSGASTFSYVVSDGALESTALVTVQVLASGVVPVAEGAPIAQPDAYVVSGRRLQTAASNGVLRNDTDSSGRAGRGLQAFVASTPRHGLLVLKPDGSFTYTAAATWSGTDSFTYIARGAGGQSAPAKVTLRVGVPIDDTPPIVTLAGAAQRTLIRLPVVRGSAVDTYVLPGRGMVFSSGLKSVVLRLQNPRGLFFNGRTFQTAPFDLATRQAGRSFFELARALPLSVPDGRYTFTAIATDNTGKTGRASQFVTVDATPPLVTLDNPRDSGGNTARIAGFTGLAGRTSGAAQVLVALRRGDGGFWNGRAYQSEPFWLSATLRASTYSLPNASLPGRNNLPPGRYTISVRARDEASNTATIGRTVFVESSAGR
jgi:VCBS repeat-containing protein